MKLIVLGSSSSGNGYVLLDTSGKALVVEAGVSLIELKKALNFRISSIAGCLVSHSHNDHSRYAPDYQKTGMSLYMSDHTREEIFKGKQHSNVTVIEEKIQETVGPFLVKPFHLEHDVKNYGFLIHHHESGLICFITDTHYCPFTFKGLRNIMVECNYLLPTLDYNVHTGSVIPKVRDRILSSHMELQTTKDFLKYNDLTRVNNIVLLHLSRDNSDGPRMRKEIQEQTGKSVHIATPGLKIDLNETAI